MAPIVKFFKDLLYDKILPALRNTTTKRLMIGFGFFIVTTLILSLNFVPERVDIEVGQPSPKTIKANKTIEFEDKVRTSEARRKAAESVGRVHQEKPEALEQVLSDINDVMSKIRAVKANTQLTPQERAKLLKDNIPFALPEGAYLSLASYNPQTIKNIDYETKDIVTRALGKGILEENIEQTRISLKKEDVAASDLPKDAKTFMGALIDRFLQPNYIYDAKATEVKMEAAMDSVAPVRVTLQRGEKIIGEGDIAKPEHIQKLSALGLLKAPVPVSAVIGIAMLVGLGMMVVMVYLYQHRNDIYQNESTLILVSLIVIFALLLAKTVMAIEFKGEWSGLLGYFIPVAFSSMLIAILVDKKLALLVTAILSGMVGIISGNELRFALVGLISGLVAVYSVSKLSQRSDLAKAGLLYVSSANIVAILSVELVTRGMSTATLAAGILLGLLNGVFSAVLTIGALPYLESAFGITSSVKLLELANPSHPLLKQLLI
ncbi:MAG TPA: phosphohydrolase, partial [Desulfobacteria bacterium]|nr:phosphohydrolase [Desulfobacteria bacterium]